MYYGARYYDPWVGRFLSQDPDLVGPVGGGSFAAIASDPRNFNAYTYALNAPTRYTDPTGRAPHPKVFELPHNGPDGVGGPNYSEGSGDSSPAGGGSAPKSTRNASGGGAERTAASETRPISPKALAMPGSPADVSTGGKLGAGEFKLDLRSGSGVATQENPLEVNITVAEIPAGAMFGPREIPVDQVGPVVSTTTLSLTTKNTSIPISVLNGDFVSGPRHIFVSVGVGRAGVWVTLRGDVLVQDSPNFSPPKEILVRQ